MLFSLLQTIPLNIFFKYNNCRFFSEGVCRFSSEGVPAIAVSPQSNRSKQRLY